MARKRKTSTTATADVATLKEVIATAGDEVNPLAAEEYKCLGEEGTRELIKLCKDNFLQDVTAQGDGKVLTLSASPTADGKGVSITGEADTYTKQEITSMISTSQGGGITGATTDATPPLSLDAEVSDGLLNISGSVDLSSKQDALNYYSEYATDAAIIVNNSRMGVSDTQVSVNSPAVEIYSSQDSNSHITMISNSDNIQLYKGISLNTSDKVTYNDKEIATVDDIPTQVSALENDAGYITESAVEGKQDKLQYYEEYSTSGGYGARIEAGDGFFFVENASAAETGNYTGHAFIGQGDGVGIDIQNHVIYIGGETVSIDSAPNPATYNGKEIATVDDVPIVSVGERNLLTNSQFDGLDGWTINGTVSVTSEKLNGWKVVDIYFEYPAGGIQQTIRVSEGKYYKFSCWAKSDGVGCIMLHASYLTTVYSENDSYKGEDWKLITLILKATSSEDVSVSIDNYPSSSSATCDVYISMPTFEEISEMAVIEDKFADVITLDSLRLTYPSETLLTMLDYWFTSGSNNIITARVMDYDEVSETARIRFTYSLGGSSPYFLVLSSSSSNFGESLITAYINPVVYETPSGQTVRSYLAYFDIIVPCKEGELVEMSGFKYMLNYRTSL